MKLAILLLAGVSLLGAETFEVVHLKRGWFDGRGILTVTSQGIEFHARKKKHSRKWSWLDIQHFDRISESELEILTYEDQLRLLGQDRSYRFRLVKGKFSDELLEKIRQELTQPVTNRRFATPQQALYRIPVKHLHTLGGCQGELVFTGDRIYYATGHKKDAREWRLGQEVESVWSMNRYQLEIHVWENNRREFSRTRVYQFQLKQPLDSEFYRRLKLQLYGLEARMSLAVPVE